VKVFLAGRVGVQTDAVVLDEARFPGRQGRLLFAYLLVEQGRPVPHDELAEALWGPSPPATWDKALRVLVSKLRELLRQLGVDGASALTGAFGCYRLELPEDTWVDVIVAADAAEEAEAALAAGEPGRAKAAATLSASLLRQPFLPGDDGAWVEAKRRELGDLHGRALTALAEACLRSDEGLEAVTWAEQAVELAPFRESGYRQLMEAHVSAGNRAEALRVYERCRRLLADELGAYPSPETESIYRGLLERPSARPEARRAPELPRTDAGRPRRSRGKLLALVAGGAAATAAIAAVLLAAMLSGTKGGSADARFATVGQDAVAAFDPSTGHPLGSAPLAASPGAIAYGDGSVWVTMPNQDSVARIAPATSTVEQTTGVGHGPAGIAAGDGFIWVANSLDGSVSKIDPQRNGGQEVDRIAVGNGPTGVAYGLGRVWVANSVDRTVQPIDPRTDRPGRPIPVDTGADAIAAGDGAVWVTGESAGVLARLDPGSGNVISINVGNAPDAVAAGPGAVWVANGEDATVSRVDPANNHVVGMVTVGEGPSGLALAPGGKLVWVANALSGTLSKIDPTAGKAIENVPVGNQPQGVTTNGSAAYVAVQGSNGGAHRGGTLTVAIAVPPADAYYNVGLVRGLDPASGDAWELTTLTNDGLLGYGRSGGAEGDRVVPDLAVALPTVSDGGRTYTFQLWPGIRYSTGAVVRPADVRRGIERSLLAVGRWSYFIGIVGAASCVARPESCDLSRGIVTRPGSSTVVIHLAAPDPDFLYKLALPESDVVPARTPIEAHVPLPATGPYEVARIDEKRGLIVLVRNRYFHLWSSAAQPNGYPDRIVERFGYTGASAVHAVQRGTADITSNGLSQAWSPALVSSLQTRDSSRLHGTPTKFPIGVWFNTRLPPFDDVRVRRAVNYAVDRNRLLQLAGGPAVAQIGCQMLPPNVVGYRPFCPFTLHPNAAGAYNGPDLAKAHRLVTASGTKGQAVTVWFYENGIGRRNSAYLVSVLKSLGYRASRKLLPQKGPLWRPNRQAGAAGIGSNFPSPSDALSLNFTCDSYVRDPKANGNYAEFCNRRIDAEIAHASSLQITDLAASARLWTRIDRELTELAPWVVTRESLAADLVSRRVGNYTPCWLSFVSGVTAVCLDQLWVR
jgi:YVTN family beta-propeller protein